MFGRRNLRPLSYLNRVYVDGARTSGNREGCGRSFVVAVIRRASSRGSELPPDESSGAGPFIPATRTIRANIKAALVPTVFNGLVRGKFFADFRIEPAFIGVQFRGPARVLD